MSDAPHPNSKGILSVCEGDLVSITGFLGPEKEGRPLDNKCYFLKGETQDEDNKDYEGQGEDAQLQGNFLF